MKTVMVIGAGFMGTGIAQVCIQNGYRVILSDVGMRLGYGWNIGPFEIADNAGLDTFLRVGQSMKSLGQNHLYSDSGLIENMVADGKLGRKSGEGFYRYDPESGKKLTKPIGDGQKQRSNDA